MRKLLSVLSVLTLAAIAAGSASAGSINTPSDLAAGDSFRIIFTTSTKTTATSSDLATYDSFVSTDASGTTYNSLQVTWKAIVSNATINARDHIGLLSSSLVRIYTADGTRVSNGNLWSTPLLASVNKKIDGTPGTAGTVWTGTKSAGDTNGITGLGQSTPIYGNNEHFLTSTWLEANFNSQSNLSSLYGISDILTAPSSSTVPEPSTAMLAGLGGLAALVYSFKRKRNSCRR
jgi:PEP-CTERM motif